MLKRLAWLEPAQVADGYKTAKATNLERFKRSAASYRHGQMDQIGRVDSSSYMPIGHSPSDRNSYKHTGGQRHMGIEHSGRYVEYFERMWAKNKAIGIAAQTKLKIEFERGEFSKHSGKLLHGCWLTSPVKNDFFKFRMATFVHGKTLGKDDDPRGPDGLLGNRAGPFYALSEFMDEAGIGVSYAIATADHDQFDFGAMMDRDYSGIRWRMFLYENERFAPKQGQDLFSGWSGRGRASYYNGWDNDALRDLFSRLSRETLDEILLNEVFYSGYLKTVLKKATTDPYDVDGFVVSLSQKHILPIEIKEKFPTDGRKRHFGIDAGRIMMLLRLCIPNDANALYIVREVTPDRKFVGWKYITLSNMLVASSWNLQAGGRGMGGGGTQTVMIPYDEFSDMSASTFDEGNIRNIARLPDNVKDIVASYRAESKRLFSGT